MPVQHEPVSVSLRVGTLRELRQVAERRRTSTSKLAEQAISEHLRAARSLNGNGEPLARVIPREISAYDDPNVVGSGPGDVDIEVMRYFAGGGRPKLPTEPRQPRRYKVGALNVVLDRPITHAMAERIAQDVQRSIALAWAEERENGSNG